jgi:hypothetical protein
MRQALLASVLLAACTGVIGQADEPPAQTASVVRRDSVRVVRLGHRAYENTIRDLFGGAWRATFPADGAGNGFDNTAAVMGITEALALEYRDAARELAERYATRCDDVACARSFVTSFGKRAFRRPLRDAEIDAFVDLWRRTDGLTGVRLVIETMLQSPSFLFRTELGPDNAAAVRLDPFETASALSYVLWESMPDDVLFAAAERNELSTAAQLETQIRRMFADARARGPMVEMFRQWLDLRGLRDVTRESPEFPAIIASMHEETSLLVRDVVFERHGSIADLLTTPYTFVDARLASIYGVAAPASGFSRVEWDRSGVLTTAGFLTAHATPLASSPPRRGKVIAEKLLCLEIPAPPPDVAAMVPASGGGTTRDRFAAHTSNATCRGCHQYLDPLGFAFEHYDQMGRYRATDNGLPVDASGALDGPVNGAVELSQRLAKSDEVRRCFVRQTFRWALGRLDAPGETEALATKFNGNIEQAFVALILSDSFLVRHR